MTKPEALNTAGLSPADAEKAIKAHKEVHDLYLDFLMKTPGALIGNAEGQRDLNHAIVEALRQDGTIR